MILLKLWIAIFIEGLAFYPLTSCVFKKYHDRGWIFSKIIGICISSWTMWMLSYLKMIKYTKNNSYFIILFFFIINIIGIAIRNKKKKKTIKMINYGLICNVILTELLFIICLGFWTFIKGYNGTITNYTEQFMDYGYMNSTMNSEYMPPQDIWLSGENINYYYFGQYISGFICKIADLNASEGYFLIIALIAACTFILPASIGYNLFRDKISNKKKSIFNTLLPFIVSLFIGLSVSTGGTLHYTFYKWISEDKDSYSYIDETRYIGFKPDVEDKTATEVPAYSSIIGDLHAHYIDLVFSLTTIALLSQMFITNKDNNKESNNLKNPYYIIHLLLISLMLGIQKMTNYWDFPIYIVIISGTIITKKLICGNFNIRSIIITLLSLIGIFAVEEIITLPFTLDLTINGTNVNFTGIMSPLYKLLIKWGLQTLCVVGFLILYLLRYKKSNEKFKKYLNNNLADLFIIIIGVCALGLVITPEIFYLKDIYGDNFKRFNTMFKLTYQAYILYSISTSYIIFALLSDKKKIIDIMAFFTLTVYATTIGYGIDAFITNYKDVDHVNISERETERYINNTIPEDYKAIQWIRDNVDKNKTILEATKLGNSYSTYSRISTFTGNPTVLGWVYHEWIWRSNKDYSMPQELNDRESDIKALYTSNDYITANYIIKKYNIDYIYIGSTEMYTYQNIDLNFLLSLGKKVYNENSTYLIEINH